MIVIWISFFALLFCPGIHSFEAGWTSNFVSTEDSTHYSMSECAGLEMAAEYLKTVYGITSIQSIINVQYGRCDANPIYKAINTELDRLKIEKKKLKSAIESVAEANRKLDFVEMTSEKTHFDSEQFDEGAMLISQRLDAAISSINMKDYKKARESFGSSLHTVQDFYSHSNWIEIGHRVPNKGIGKYEVLGKYAPKNMRTCVDCEGESCRTNIVPAIIRDNVLTSGYFNLKGLGSLFGSPKPFGKCSHGGATDTTTSADARGGGINKDTLTSDHGHLHKTAASVAYDATKQIFHEFWKTIGNEPFGQFLGLADNQRNLSSNSLIIVMDTTGSMGAYIAMAKQIAIGIVDIYQTLEYKPVNYILSPFNDPHWGPLTISLSPQEFRDEISKLSADGGDDIPELYYHGILEALRACESDSSLYAFTDAPAKDAYLKSEAIQLAKEKRVTVTLFYAKSSFRQHQIGHVSPKVPDVIEDLTIHDGYDLSSITGGVIMGVNSQSLNATKDYIIDRLDMSKQRTIMLARGFNSNFTFNVDSSIKSLRIEVTSSRALSAASFFLIEPAGEIFSPRPTSQTPYILIYTVPIEEKSIGEWKIISRMNVDHNVQLNAVSEVSCMSTLQKQIIGSSSNVSFVSLTGQPIQGEEDVFVLTVCENLPSNVATGRVHLIDATDGSKILKVLTPIQTTPSGFLSRIEIPNANFHLSTFAQLQDNTTIQTQEKQLISPTSISLSIDNQPYTVIVNETLRMNYTIYNHGQTQLRVALRVGDALNLLPTNGILQAYDIDAMNNRSDTIEINTIKLNEIFLNSTMITDSVIFSISSRDYEYDQTVFVYIQQADIPLTNQTDYQRPPTSPTPIIINNSAYQQRLFPIQFILFFIGFWFIYI
ncbi:hypothetical protein I4U23_005106 [Adineta vaga]|nr:hypothetical protein I4U23_005106 [Adineta vaga]